MEINSFLAALVYGWTAIGCEWEGCFTSVVSAGCVGVRRVSTQYLVSYSQKFRCFISTISKDFIQADTSFFNVFYGSIGALIRFLQYYLRKKPLLNTPLIVSVAFANSRGERAKGI